MAASSGGSSGYRQMREQEAQFLNTIRDQGVQIRQYTRALQNLGVIDSVHALPFHREAVDAEILRLDELKQRMTTELEDIESEIASLAQPPPPAPPSSEDIEECVDNIVRALSGEEALLKELLKRMPSLPLPLDMESHDTMVREAHAMFSSHIERMKSLESSQAESNAGLQRLSTSLLERLPSEAQIKEYESLGNEMKTAKETIATQLQRLQQLQARLEIAEGQIKRLGVLRQNFATDSSTILRQRQELFRLRDVESRLTTAQTEANHLKQSEKDLTSRNEDLCQELSLKTTENAQIVASLVTEQQRNDQLRQEAVVLHSSLTEEQSSTSRLEGSLRQVRWEYSDLCQKLSLKTAENAQIAASLVAEQQRNDQLRQEAIVLRSSFMEERSSTSRLEGSLRQVKWEYSDLEETLGIANSHIGRLLREKDQAKLESEVEEVTSREDLSELHLRLERLQVSNNDQTDEIASLKKMCEVLCNEVHLMLLAQEATEAKFAAERSSRDAMIEYYAGLSNELEEQLRTARSQSESLNLQIGAEQMSTQELQMQLQVSQTRLADLDSASRFAQEATEAKFAAMISSRDAMIKYHTGLSNEMEEQLRIARSQNESFNLQIGAEQMATQELQMQLQVSQTRLADLESAASSGRLHSDCRNRYSSLLLLHQEAEREVSRLDGIHFQRTYQMAALREEVRALESKLDASNISLESQSQKLQHLDEDKRKMESRHQQRTENIQMILGAVLSVDISPLGFNIESIAQISRALIGEEMNNSASTTWTAEFDCLTDEKARVDDWHMLRCFLEMNIISFDELRAVVTHIDSRDNLYGRWTVSIMLAFLEHISDITVSQLSVSEAIPTLSLFDLINRYLHGTSVSGRIATSYNQLRRNLTGAIESSPLVGGLADCVFRGISGLRQPLHQSISECAAQRQLSMSKDGIELILDQKRLILLSKCDDESPLTLLWPGQFRLVAGVPLVLKVLDENQQELRSFAWDITQDRSGATMAGKLFRHTLRHLSQGSVGRGFQA